VTYRPDCLDDLLSTAAQVMRRPSGRLLLSLQDRAGEASSLEDAVTRSRCLRIDSRTESVAHDMDDEVQVIIFELSLDSDSGTGFGSSSMGFPGSATLDFVPSTAEEVEAEFERLTGIRPEKVLLPVPSQADKDDDKTSSSSSAATRKPGESFKQRVVQDFLARGLGDYLSDTGDLKTKAGARPFSETQSRHFAESHYATAVAAAVAEEEEEHKEEQKVGQDNGGLVEGLPAGPGLDAPPAPLEPQVRICLEGLDWDLSVESALLVANVTFGDDLWAGLCGVSGSDAFKDAVSFELAERELRVLHAGTVVLDLHLPVPVDANRAIASLSSRKRRVAVKVPTQAERGG